MDRTTVQKEKEKVESQFDQFDKEVKNLTLDRLNETPREETETQMSSREIAKAKEIRLTPHRVMWSGPAEKGGKPPKFNEKFREDYEFDKQYVRFVAHHNECKGESIDIWTKPYAGIPAEEWIIPTDVVVWGPRYLANRLKGCFHHRLVMKEPEITGSDHAGQYYGKMVADTTVQRLDATPVSNRKCVFMGADD
jgi:hypothetical protein